MRYQTLAEIFYGGTDKYNKAMSAAKLMDNRLANDYQKQTSDIHFDMSNYLKYFDYYKLANIDGYTEKIIKYYKTFKT